MRKFTGVLIVDDDYASNYLTEIILTDLQLTSYIHIARNGKEALDLVKEHCLGTNSNSLTCPQLILLDINMPIMDGFEFLEEFEKLQFVKDQSIPILLLTTSINFKDIEKARSYQVAGYIEKPLTEEKITTILNKF